MLGWLRRKAVSAPRALAGVEIARDTVPAQPVPASVEWAPTVPMSLSGVDEEAARRASELRRLAALQARGDAAYQYVVETAARICGTPLAGICLQDGDTMQFKAVVGLSLPGVPADAAPCSVVMKSTEPVTVMTPPALDGFAARLVAVAGGQPLHFYAGARLFSARGVPVGTVWVADVTPRELTPVQLRTLELLARQTTLLMESRAP